MSAARDILANALGIDPAEIDDDTRLGTHPKWDSIAHMRLILAIEAAKGAPLPTEAILAVSCLADIEAQL